MNRTFAFALALAGFAASANAGDLSLDSVKDPLPDTLTWHGVTIYGTVDVGYAYQSDGRPTGAVVTTLEFNPVTTTRNYTGQAISTIAANGLEQSKIGVKIEENIGYGLTAIGKLDTGFDPLTGELSNGCVSFLQNGGSVAGGSLPPSQQTSNADSGRCGQALNGVAYGGLSSGTYGTLTIGRQQSLQLDGIATYDPMALSYAFSLIGYSGSNGGSGSTEAARWDNSVKYVYQYGPVHAAAMYSNGGEDTGMLGTGYGFNVGGSWKGFSLDAVYTKENGAVNLRDAKFDTSSVLLANITNNKSWSVMGKYTYDFGGGFKDEGPGAKLTFFGGYTHIDQTQGDNTPTADAAGGYFVYTNPNYLLSTKQLDYVWTGAKYELPSGLSFTGAYYYEYQNRFNAGPSGVTGITATTSGGSTCPLGGASKSNCAGNSNTASFVADYAFNKHFDVYGGVAYAAVDGGLASGFPNVPTSGANATVDTTVVMTGLRLKF